MTEHFHHYSDLDRIESAIYDLASMTELGHRRKIINGRLNTIEITVMMKMLCHLAGLLLVPCAVTAVTTKVMRVEVK